MYVKNANINMWHHIRDPRNCMVARCCICALICNILKVPWILEQPASSVLECHPLFQLLCKRWEIFRVP